MARLASILLALSACSTAIPAPEGVEQIPGELQALSAPELGRIARDLIGRREQPGALDRAIDLLAWHAHAAPSADLDLLLAEAHARSLEALDLKRAEDRPYHAWHRERALRRSEAALKALPEDAAARYWRASVLLHAADAELSYKRMTEALKLLEEVEKAAPGFDEGGPARTMGRIYQETPGWPMIGSPAKAMACYRRSLEHAPDHPLTSLWMGEVWKAAGKLEEARAAFEKAASLPLRPGREGEDARLRTRALRELELLTK
jgi:tetratricopeptide (TPR) repeat protein